MATPYTFDTSDRPRHTVGAVSADATDTIRGIADVFDEHFDRGWTATLILRSSADPQNLRELRGLLAQQARGYAGPETARDLVRTLRTFLREVRDYVLPGVDRQLGLHADLPASWRRRDDFVHRRMLAYVLPHNVDRLEALTERLAAQLRVA
jgi:hypothetical protein